MSRDRTTNRTQTGHQTDAASQATQDQVDGAELALAAQDARIASLESQLQAKDTQIDQTSSAPGHNRPASGSGAALVAVLGLALR